MSRKKRMLIQQESTDALTRTIASSEVPMSIINKINAAHGEVTVVANNAVVHAIECGRLLAEAKEKIPHGQWVTWLRINVPQLKDRTDRLYRQMYASRERIESSPKSLLTISDATRVIGNNSTKRQRVALVKRTKNKKLFNVEGCQSLACPPMKEVAGGPKSDSHLIVEMGVENITEGITVDATETIAAKSVSIAEKEPMNAKPTQETIVDNARREIIALIQQFEANESLITRDMLATVLWAYSAKFVERVDKELTNNEDAMAARCRWQNDWKQGRRWR